MKRFKNIHIFLLLLAFGACSDSTDSPVSTEKAVAVSIKKVASIPSAKTVWVSGEVRALNAASLSSRIAANIERMEVKIGDKVSKGDVLLALDSKDIKAAIARSEAAVVRAEATASNTELNYKRIKALWNKQSASQKEYDDIKTARAVSSAQLSSARQALAAAKAQLNYALLKAPFDGIITGKSVKEGDLATPGKPLLTMENNARFEVLAKIPESKIAALTKSTPVKIEIPVLQQTFESHLTELSSSSQFTAGQYLATFGLRYKGASIRSGMYARVQLPMAGKSLQEKIFIDKNALVYKGQLVGIYTVSEQNTALLRWLQIGAVDANQVEVVSGLNPNESYIVSAQGKLYNGAPVAIK